MDSSAEQGEPGVLGRQDDRRSHQRVVVNFLGRFMLEDLSEYPCQTQTVSPANLAVLTPVVGRLGERVVAYIDQIGRIEGKIVRTLSGGFVVAINATARKKDKLATKLMWLANRHELNLPEDRRHDRVAPRGQTTTVTLPDGREYCACVVDVSLSGIAVEIEVKPPEGSPLMIGKIRARVVHHFEEGIAAEFETLQTAASLEHDVWGVDGS